MSEDTSGKNELITNFVEQKGLDFHSYVQVFNERHGFVPNLSILDLLFCEGPAAKNYIEQVMNRL